MSGFLLDANLSPDTAVFLAETLGLDVVHQREVLPGSPTDEEIVAFAKEHRRVIITFDRGFGERYHRRERGQIGIIVLRLRNQRRHSVEQTLTKFLADQAPSMAVTTSLVIIDENGVRVVSAS